MTCDALDIDFIYNNFLKNSRSAEEGVTPVSKQFFSQKIIRNGRVFPLEKIESSVEYEHRWIDFELENKKLSMDICDYLRSIDIELIPENSRPYLGCMLQANLSLLNENCDSSSYVLYSQLTSYLGLCLLENLIRHMCVIAEQSSISPKYTVSGYYHFKSLGEALSALKESEDTDFIKHFKNTVDLEILSSLLVAGDDRLNIRNNVMHGICTAHETAKYRPLIFYAVYVLLRSLSEYFNKN